MNKVKLTLTFFWLVVAVHLLGHLFDLDVLTVTKPLIVISLIIYLYVSVNERSKVFYLTLAALFLSWLGDVFLMFEGQNPIFFILGLASFLLAHVIYVFSYRKAKNDTAINPLLSSQKLRHGSTLVLAGLALVYILEPGLGEMKIPVIIYASVIVLMAITALLRYGYTSIQSFSYVFGGAVMFMVSDSLLAVNKFLEPYAYAGFWIMSTYCFAQFLIVKGIIMHINAKKGA
jgi:uncharacterized membrane protein YhhN